ncbi:hypothetical protein [Streptomyces sp. NRRL S-237]|uniref:hypothetical protein n=1 Tax=Streptomyces sp. NRRL S-237 TaxID=1463895 RepID=UPI0004CB0B97|nr:hypothetical protein [Streptomyces sp. NRRL S-237]
MSAASTALAPILHWRALAAGSGHTFGTVEADPEQYTEAEDAVRRDLTTIRHGNQLLLLPPARRPRAERQPAAGPGS